MKGITALSVGYCVLCLAFTTWHAARWAARMLSWRALLLRADLAWASKALAHWHARRARRRGDTAGAAVAYEWGARRAAWLLGSGCEGSWPRGDACKRYPKSQTRGVGECLAPVHESDPTRAEVRAFALCQVGVDDVLVTLAETSEVRRAMATLYLEAVSVEVVRELVARTRLPDIMIRRALRRLHVTREVIAPVITPAERVGLTRYSGKGESRRGRTPAILDPEFAAPPSTKRAALTAEREAAAADASPRDVDDQAEACAIERPTEAMLQALVGVGAPTGARRGGAS